MVPKTETEENKVKRVAGDWELGALAHLAPKGAVTALPVAHVQYLAVTVLDHAQLHNLGVDLG